jgi:poly(hydroxyalkanoate) granule-associated protein
MARKSKTRSTRGSDSGDAGQAIRDSAQKIWLAGLGAFERARTEGPRMFETLVEQGRNMGARAVGAADEALRSVRESGYSGANLQKLEQALEERVNRSLSRLGVMTTREVEALNAQIRELSEAVRRMAGNDGARGGSRKSTGRKAKAKAAAPRARTRKAAAGATTRRTAAKGTRTRRKRAAAA